LSELIINLNTTSEPREGQGWVPWRRLPPMAQGPKEVRTHPPWKRTLQQSPFSSFPFRPTVRH